MRAAVNSWIITDSGKWETAADWSLDVAPTNSQTAIFITNAVARFALGKSVTIDTTTVSTAPGTLNIEALTVSAPGFPNYLIVTNATFTPLQVTSLTIGAGGVVEILNSEFVIKPGSASLIDDGSFSVGGPLGSALNATNAVAVIVGNAGNGQLAISSGSSLMSSNVIVGNQSGSSGALTVSGGQFSIQEDYSNDTYFIGQLYPNLILGNSAGANGTLLLSGGSLTVTVTANVDNGAQYGYLVVGLGGVGQCTVSGGTLSLDGPDGGWLAIGQYPGSAGTLTVDGGQLQMNGGPLEIPPWDPFLVNPSGSAQMIVSAGAVAGAGYLELGGDPEVGLGGPGTLTVAGGSVSVGLELDAEETATIWITGGQLVVSPSPDGLTQNYGLLSVSNGLLQTSYMSLEGGGTLELSGGSINFANPVGATWLTNQGTAWISGGQLIITNGEIAMNSGGAMSISNGLVLAQGIEAGASSGSGKLTVAGGQLVVTNEAVIIGNGGFGELVLYGGAFLVRNVILGQNSGGQGLLAVVSSNWTVQSSLVVGDCAVGASGTVTVEGGGLYVTNSTHTAVLDVDSGQVNLDSGTLQVNTLVITNSCGLFYQNGGTLIVSNLVLAPNLSATGDGIPNSWKQQYGFNPFDPTLGGKDLDGTGFTVLQDYLAGLNPTNSHSALRIISLLPEGNNLQLTWTTAGGKTNAVQAVNGAAGGGYTTNFTDLASFVIGGSGDQTNTYIDPGGATNRPARYYRVRLVP